MTTNFVTQSNMVRNLNLGVVFLLEALGEHQVLASPRFLGLPTSPGLSSPTSMSTPRLPGLQCPASALQGDVGAHPNNSQQSPQLRIPAFVTSAEPLLWLWKAA